jgi:short-subunit dehydrogenase
LPLKLSGRTVLIAGATGGIGHAIAQRLASRGARLVVTGRNVGVLDALAGELNARAVAADLDQAPAAADLVARAGAVDVLVAGAGVPGTGRLEELASTDVEDTLAVNLRAPILLSRALVPAMTARGSGHLVFVSSLAAKAPSPSSSLYCATKAGLRGFATALRAELRGSGVGVSTILPGFVSDAGMFYRSGVELPFGVGTRSPLDVADAVIEAIEHDRAEIAVAPPSQRMGATFAAMAPRVAAAVNRRLGGDRIAEAIAAAQRDQR